MTEAVWNPPVQMTGTDTACLTRYALPRLSPSIRSSGGQVRSQRRLKTLRRPGVWKMSQLRSAVMPPPGRIWL